MVGGERYPKYRGDLDSHSVGIADQIPPGVPERAPSHEFGLVLLSTVTPEGLPIDTMAVAVDLDAAPHLDISEVGTADELPGLVANLILCDRLGQTDRPVVEDATEPILGLAFRPSLPIESRQQERFDGPDSTPSLTSHSADDPGNIGKPKPAEPHTGIERLSNKSWIGRAKIDHGSSRCSYRDASKLGAVLGDEVG